MAGIGGGGEYFKAARLELDRAQVADFHN
jgi:hypothetical protein